MMNFTVAAASMIAAVSSFAPQASASDWGCEVLLCISNPGGPTQYTECVPPMNKLYSELRKGHGFPSCRGVGFSASKPVYDPYQCPTGYALSYSTSGREHMIKTAICRSKTKVDLPPSKCQTYDYPRWQPRPTGCVGFDVRPATKRERPRRIEVDIQGVGKQTVWF